MLVYADYNLPFVLQMDGSLKGPGAVVMQVQDGQEQVIAYASWQLWAEQEESVQL